MTSVLSPALPRHHLQIQEDGDRLLLARTVDPERAIRRPRAAADDRVQHPQGDGLVEGGVVVEVDGAGHLQVGLGVGEVEVEQLVDGSSVRPRWAARRRRW